MSTQESTVIATWRRRGEGTDPTLLRDDHSYRPEPGESHVRGLEVKRELGRGGMGVVLTAHQRDLARDVALKTLGPAPRPAHARALRAEAVACGSLEHPGIVPAHFTGQLDGRPFFAMQVVSGSTWAAHLREAPRDLERELRVLLEVSQAVAFAHSRGICHNDLKPSNVMLGAFGEVLVVDWGLATAFDERPAAPVRRATSIDVPCGTPRYFAPELARGDGAAIGPPTDVYLLGAILFELLTGRGPHASSNAVFASMSALSGRVPPLPADAPAELAAICRRAMASAPTARYPDAAAFRQALRRFLDHSRSRRLCEAAVSRLELPPGLPPRAAYRRLRSALVGFAEARRAWVENPDVAAGQARAHRTFAERALAAGDLALAERQLAEAGPATESLRAQVAAARRRAARQKRTEGRLRRGLTAIAAIWLLLLTGGWLGLEALVARETTAREAAERRARLARGTLQRAVRSVHRRLLGETDDPEVVHLARELLDSVADGWSALAAQNRGDPHLLAEASLELAALARATAASPDTVAIARVFALLDTLPDSLRESVRGRALYERAVVERDRGLSHQAARTAAEGSAALRGSLPGDPSVAGVLCELLALRAELLLERDEAGPARRLRDELASLARELPGEEWEELPLRMQPRTVHLLLEARWSSSPREGLRCAAELVALCQERAARRGTPLSRLHLSEARLLHGERLCQVGDTAAAVVEIGPAQVELSALLEAGLGGDRERRAGGRAELLLIDSMLGAGALSDARDHGLALLEEWRGLLAVRSVVADRAALCETLLRVGVLQWILGGPERAVEHFDACLGELSTLASTAPDAGRHAALRAWAGLASAALAGEIEGPAALFARGGGDALQAVDPLGRAVGRQALEAVADALRAEGQALRCLEELDGEIASLRTRLAGQESARGSRALAELLLQRALQARRCGVEDVEAAVDEAIAGLEGSPQTALFRYWQAFTLAACGAPPHGPGSLAWLERAERLARGLVSSSRAGCCFRHADSAEPGSHAALGTAVLGKAELLLAQGRAPLPVIEARLQEARDALAAARLGGWPPTRYLERAESRARQLASRLAQEP